MRLYIQSAEILGKSVLFWFRIYFLKKVVSISVSFSEAWNICSSTTFCYSRCNFSCSWVFLVSSTLRQLCSASTWTSFLRSLFSERLPTNNEFSSILGIGGSFPLPLSLPLPPPPPASFSVGGVLSKYHVVNRWAHFSLQLLVSHLLPLMCHQVGLQVFVELQLWFFKMYVWLVLWPVVVILAMILSFLIFLLVFC